MNSKAVEVEIVENIESICLPIESLVDALIEKIEQLEDYADEVQSKSINPSILESLIDNNEIISLADVKLRKLKKIL